MKLVTNKSKNLLYRIQPYSNCNVQFGTSYAIATQISVDSLTALSYNCQYRKDSTYLMGAFSGNLSKPEKITRTFTTPVDLDYNQMVFGVNGKSADTLVKFPIKLKPSTTYTFTCNFTNITQGSISWKDMMLVEGSTVGEYEPYSYNLLDKNKFLESNSNYINNGDGSITTTGIDFSFQRLFMDFDSDDSSSISKENSIAYLTYGHKILIDDNGNSTGTAWSNAAGYVWELNSTSVNAGGSYGGKGEIFTNNKLSLADIKRSYFYMKNNGGEAVTFSPALYDLTAMYGAGNEPTTVEQFYTDHPELKVSPLGFIGLKNLEISNKNIKRLKYQTGIKKNLFNINNYSIIGEDIGFDISGLEIGKTYTISCNQSNFKWVKISNSPDGHNSVATHPVPYNKSSFTFVMSRNSNIPETATQYIFLQMMNSTSSGFARNLSELGVNQIQIEEGSTATYYVDYNGCLDLGIIPSNSGYILNKYNNLSEELLEENIEKDTVNYHIPDKTNILLNKIEGNTKRLFNY